VSDSDGDRVSFSRSLTGRILLLGVLPSLLLLLGIVLYTGYSTLRSEQARTEAGLRVRAEQIAAEIERGNTRAVVTVKAMAFAQESGQFGRRAESSEYARRILESFPEFTGAYFGYEPDADQEDRAFRSSPEGKRLAGGLDDSGRFLPYWFRDTDAGGALRLEPLVDMEESLYYQGVKDRFLASGEPDYLITEPYEYEGKLIVEQVYPIVIDGEFRGVAGVDRALDDIVADLKSIGSRDQLDVFLVSRSGRFIAATTAGGDALRTRPVSETPYAAVMAAGLGNRAETQLALLDDPVDGRPFYFASAPVRVGDWLVMIRLPEETVLAPVRAVIVPIGLLSLLGLGLVGAISLGIIRRTARRIGRAVALADTVAAGSADESMRLETGAHDEVGRLNDSFNRMLISQARVTEVCSAISEGDFSQRVPLRSKADRLAIAINDMAEKRQKAEAELRESRERFERTVAGSGEGLWDYDPKAGRAWVSERFARILGSAGIVVADDSPPRRARVVVRLPGPRGPGRASGPGASAQVPLRAGNLGPHPGQVHPGREWPGGAHERFPVGHHRSKSRRERAAGK
jgi:methyl-accepting chemotaxis protein